MFLGIDWKSRFQNKTFLSLLVPTIFIFVQAILLAFNIDWDFTQLNENIQAIIVAGYGLYTLLLAGVDTSTPGISDSNNTINK